MTRPPVAVRRAGPSSRAPRALAHYGGTMLPMFTGLATAPLTARALGPAGRGDVAIIVAVASFLVLAGSLGLGWVARDEIAGDKDSVLFWRGLAWRIAWGFTPVAIGTAILVSVALEVSTRQGIAVALFFAVAGLTTRRAVDSSALASLGAPELNSIASAISACTVAAVIIGLFVVGQLGLTALVVANMVGFIVQMAALDRFTRRVTRERRFALEERAVELRHNGENRPRRLFARGFSSWRAQLVDATSTRADLLAVTVAGPRASVGLYSVAALIPQIAYFLYFAIVQASYGRHPQLGPEQRVAYLFCRCVGAGLVVSLVGVVTGYFAIPVVFGAEFVASRGFLLPASAMAVGLAGLAAILPDLGRRSARHLVVLAAPAVAAAAVLPFGAAPAVITLGLGCLTCSAVYCVRRCGWHALANFGGVGRA